MQNTDIHQFKEVCSRLRESIPSPYTSSWDEDFQVVRIVFNKTETKPMLTALSREFAFRWDFTTIDSASDLIENFISSIFGIIPGQILFTSGQTEAPILFAVWWPWGNEDYISLRIGVYPSDNGSHFNQKTKDILMDWFSL